MSVTYGGLPCVDPDAFYRSCLIQHLPIDPWFGKVNHFAYGRGMEAGIGYLLMVRSDLNKLNLKQGNTLKFGDGKSDAPILNIWVVDTKCVAPSWRGDTAATHFVTVADRRYFYKQTPIDKGYNVRSTPGGSYYSNTLNSGVAWTWDQMVNDIWTTVGTLGTYPSLPFTPDGTPDGFAFWGTSAWKALGTVLSRLCCSLVLDVFTDVFSIVRNGVIDTAELSATNQFDTKRTWDDDTLQLPAILPQYVRTWFLKQPAPSDGSSPWYSLDNADTSPLTGTQAGMYVQVRDDLPALYDSTGTLTNSSALTSRAVERAADWFRSAKAVLPILHRVYIGSLSDDGLQPGSMIKSTAFEDRGAAIRTEILDGPDKPDPLPLWLPPVLNDPGLPCPHYDVTDGTHDDPKSIGTYYIGATVTSGGGTSNDTVTVGGAVNVQNTNYTIVYNDNQSVVVYNSTTNITYTLGSGTRHGGWGAKILNQGGGIVTLTPSSGTINGIPSLKLPPGSAVQVHYDPNTGNYTGVTLGATPPTITNACWSGSVPSVVYLTVQPVSGSSALDTLTIPLTWNPGITISGQTGTGAFVGSYYSQVYSTTVYCAFYCSAGTIYCGICASADYNSTLVVDQAATVNYGPPLTATIGTPLDYSGVFGGFFMASWLINGAPSGTGTNLQGVPVDATAPSSGQVLEYDSSTGQWVPTTPSSGTVTSVATSGSLTGGTITTTGTLHLVNDNATPGNSYYYGTDSGGAKGFFTLPAGSSGWTITDSTHTVAGLTGTLTVVGGTVSGTTPDATLTVNFPAYSVTDGTTTDAASIGLYFVGAVVTSGMGAADDSVTITGLTNPMTTTGDIIYSSDNSGTPARLAIGGGAGQFLIVSSGLPAWSGGNFVWDSSGSSGLQIYGGGGGVSANIASSGRGAQFSSGSYYADLANSTSNWGGKFSNGTRTVLICDDANNISYTPGTPANWASSAPTDVWIALDRIVAWILANVGTGAWVTVQANP